MKDIIVVVVSLAIGAVGGWIACKKFGKKADAVASDIQKAADEVKKDI